MKNLTTYSWAFFFLSLCFFSAHSVIAQHVDAKVSSNLETCKRYQTSNSISSIDFVKIKNNNREEALYYYENNWKALREVAIKKDYIQSFQLLLTDDDEKANFDIMLVTVYKDEAQYEKSETNFQEIIEARPDGLKLLNDKKPGAFRELVFYKKMKNL